MLKRERLCINNMRERVCVKERKVVCYQYERESV